MHLRDSQQQCFKDQQLLSVQSQQQNDGDSSDGGTGQFSGVEAGRAADIHGMVTVMHSVESPECGNVVAGEVPAPGPQIEQYDSSEGLCEIGNWQCGQQADVSAGGEFGGGYHHAAGQCQYGEAIDGGECVIAGGMSEF